jgi:hypothetical protein
MTMKFSMYQEKKMHHQMHCKDSQEQIRVRKTIKVSSLYCQKNSKYQP